MCKWEDNIRVTFKGVEGWVCPGSWHSVRAKVTVSSITMITVMWNPTQKTTEVPYVDMPYYTCS